MGLAGRGVCLLHGSPYRPASSRTHWYGPGTFWPILHLHYRQPRFLPLTHTPNWSFCRLYPHLSTLLPYPVCFCCFVFPPQVLKNSSWKNHMKKWWLRSQIRSGHVWISYGYTAGLSWKICSECSIFQCDDRSPPQI